MREVLGAIWVGLIVVAGCGETSNGNAGTAAAAGTAGDRSSGGGVPGTGANSGAAIGPNGSAAEAGRGTANHGGSNGESGSSFITSGNGNVGEGGGVGVSTVEGGAPNPPAEGGSAGVSTDGGSAGSGGAGGPPRPEIHCSCQASEGCIRVTVERSADTSGQPWVEWPDQADGSGTLTVSATSSSGALRQDKVLVPDASYLADDAVYGVALCVPPGTSSVRAFLDHGTDEDPGAVTSSDYLDSCADGSAACFRCFQQAVTAGAEVDLSVSLIRSCD